MCEQYLAALASDAVRTSRAVVVTGSQRAFSAGADLTEFTDPSPEATVRYYRGPGRLWEALPALAQPSIAAISGWAIGGGLELALSADLRVADETARFQLTEVSLGILPSAGGLTRLTRTDRRGPREGADPARPAVRRGPRDGAGRRQPAGRRGRGRGRGARVGGAPGRAAAARPRGHPRPDRPLGGQPSGGLAGAGEAGAGDARALGRELPRVVSRIAIVTGGGTGIGRATALALHRDGCRVVISGRRPEPLEEVRGRDRRADCLALAGDIREPEVADALIDLALERLGRIDVLVNNAGGQFMAPAEEITPNGWAAVRRLNLDAPWYLTQQVAVRSMIPNRGGRIVSVVLCPTRGIPGMAHSSAARLGTEAVARVLSVEWGRFDIGVVCVAPGWIDTEGMRRYGDDLTSLRSSCRWAAGHSGGGGRHDRLPGLAGGAYITGQTIVIDGGIENTHALVRRHHRRLAHLATLIHGRAAPPPASTTLATSLREHAYLADRGLATVLHLSLVLEKPLLLEGEAGVGKTELAKALAELLRRAPDPAAVLRGHRRRPRALRLELRRASCSTSARWRPAAPQDARETLHELFGARVPGAAPAAGRDRERRRDAAGAADRRDRPRRRRVRGVPAGAALRLPGHDPRDRHDRAPRCGRA